MSLGLWILLSALLLGTVALFIATKDRWNWRRILARSASTFAIIAVLGAAALMLVRRLQNRPERITQVWDVSLGASKEEVRFLRGEPTTISDDGHVWTYEVHFGTQHLFTYEIGFTPDRVHYIIYYGDEGRSPLVAGVRARSSFNQDTRARLGKPSHIESSPDGLKRLYFYDRWNAVFALEQNIVYGVGAIDPGRGRIVFRDSQKP